MTNSPRARTRHRASVVCVHQNQILTVKLEDPTTKIVQSYLPGGQIESGETPAEAAERETLEETGYLVKVDLSSHLEASYPFIWHGEEIQCLTYFFAAKLQSETPVAAVQPCSYHKGVFWEDLEKKDMLFGFHPIIYSQIKSVLKNMGKD